MAGFEWKYNLSGGRALIQVFFPQDTETLTKGDIGNANAGEIDLAVTSDNNLVGAIQGAFDPADEAVAGVIVAVDSVTRIKVITNPDAVYAVNDDNNARDFGDLLDIAGATGAQTLAAAANNEFVVAKTKLQAADDTLVMIASTANALMRV